MSDAYMRDRTGKIIGRFDGNWIRDRNGTLVARYDKFDNRTRDRMGKIVGSGDLRMVSLGEWIANKRPY